MLVTQLCLTLCDHMNCSPRGSSVHDTFQARILGWHSLLQGIFPTQGLNLCLLCLPALAGGFFTTKATWEAQNTNYQGLKITVCMRSWDQFRTTRYKKIPTPPKRQLPLLKSSEQKQGVRSKSRVLYMPPALNTTGCCCWCCCSGPSPGRIPTFTPFKEQACPPTVRSQQGKLLLVLTPSCGLRSP